MDPRAHLTICDDVASVISISSNDKHTMESRSQSGSLSSISHSYALFARPRASTPLITSTSCHVSDAVSVISISSNDNDTGSRYHSACSQVPSRASTYTPSSHASSRASTPSSCASTPLIKNEGRLFSRSASFSPNPFCDCISCHGDENGICICCPQDNDWFSDHEAKGGMACKEGKCLGCVGDACGFCICTMLKRNLTVWGRLTVLEMSWWDTNTH